MDTLNLYLRYDQVDEDLPLDEPNLIRVGKKHNGRMWTGYVNKLGKEVVPCKYITRDYRFICGLLAIYDENMKIGFINVNGDFVYKCQFDDATGFESNLCGVAKEIGGLRRYGVIDNKGNLIVDYKYSLTDVQPYGCIIAQDAYAPSNRGCGLLDYRGNEITSFTYKQMGPVLSNGTLEFISFDGIHGIMDTSGKVLEVLPY